MFQLPPFTRCRMIVRWLSVGLLLSCTAFSSAQEDLKPPEFPDVFRVEVQGIFHNEQVEVDGSLYYDKNNNRAALFFLYQKVSTKFIYNFNDNEMVNIDGSECTTTPIPDDPNESFFPFTVDKKGQKQIADPKEIFYFTKSTLDRQELSIIPSYVYTAKLDFPKYGRKDCDVMHVFSKPELELPNCDNHACKSTLMAISVKCDTPEDDEANVYHTYNFFRFRTGITDTSIFQPPVGVFCNITSHQSFPGFPNYFSFSYERIEEQEDLGPDVGVHSIHKKVWYDSKLKLIRMDEFDEDGLLTSSRIFDFYGGTAYTIIASLPSCERGSLEEDIVLSEMARLPKVFFAENAAGTRIVYVGKRNMHGLDYDVWSLFFTDKETEATIVEEFYFTKTQASDQEPSKMQISHADIYTYEEDAETELPHLTMLTHLSINNYRSKPKEWQAFDISSCFGGEQKRGFKLNVTGPAILKDSNIYEDVLERMYIKLIIATDVSVIRISELRGIFDGVDIVGFKGWLLDKSEYSNSTKEEKEPDMNTAYKRIEEAAANGKLSIKLKKDGKDFNYDVTAVEKVDVPKSKNSDCFSGASLAAAGLVLLFIGISFGIAGYYVFLKRRRKPLSIDKIQLTHASDKS